MLRRKLMHGLKHLVPLPRSIRWRLFWLLGGLSLVTVLAVLALWLPAEIREIDAFEDELQRVTVRSIQVRIDHFVREIERDLSRATRQFHMAAFEGDQEGVRGVGQWLLQQHPAFEEVGLLDPRGMETFRLSRRVATVEHVLRDHTGTSFFREGLRKPVHWDRVVITETSEPRVTLTMRFASTGGRVPGIAYAVVNLKFLWELMEDLKVSRESRAYVVDGDGRLIASSDRSLLLRQLSFAQRPVVNELIFSKNPLAVPFVHGYYVNELGIEVSATGMWLAGPSWGVFIEQPLATLYASMWRAVWFLLGLSVAGVLVSFAIAHIISRKVAAPITRLRRGAERIALGQLDHRVPAETADEIGDLARQFNRMSEALKASYDGLEEKVAARTRELSMLYTALTPLAGAEAMPERFVYILQKLISVTGADAASIRVIDKQTKAYTYVAHVGFDPQHLAVLPRTMRSGSSDEMIFADGKPIISGDILADNRITRKRQLEFGLKSTAFLPLIVQSEVRGIIHLASRKLGYFTDEKQEYLMMIARLMGIVVENQQLLQSSIKYAEDLNRSNQELEQFAYVASHDLQEPLRMITGYTQLLSKRYKGKLDQSADEFMGFVVDGAKRMQVLINDLLTYSRVGTRGKEVAPTDCALVLDKTLEGLRVAIQESGAVVTAEPLPVVMGDETQLGQLFQNLIGNAIKYRDHEPPAIHVSCQRENEVWRFAVADNGIGIDPQHAERIFQVFQRLHTREEYSGTGIGLAVCKKIVERHGGKIWVESQGVKGATFYFTLPAKLPEVPGVSE